MEGAGQIIDYNERDLTLTIKLREPLNLNLIGTYYDNDLSNVSMWFEVLDPRKFSKAQRRFYWALLDDIERYWGQPSELSDMRFKRKYANKYMDELSLADDSNTSMSHAKRLIDMVVDFILAENIEIHDAYKYLGVDQQWFYACLKHGRCCLCGARGERAHVQAVGMGRNRKTIDHTKHAFMSLCHVHHQRQHEIGINTFIEENKIIPVWLTRDDLNTINLPVIPYEKEQTHD